MRDPSFKPDLSHCQGGSSSGVPCCNAGAALQSDCQVFDAFPGIRLISMNLPPNISFSTDFAKKEQVVEFGYILKGEANTFLHESPAASAKLTQRMAVTHYLPDVPVSFQVVPKPNIQMLGVDVQLDVLREMISGDEDACPRLARFLDSGGQPRFLELTKPPANQAVVVSQMMSCTFSGLTRALFLQSKVLEFLTLQMEALKDDGAVPFQGILTRNEEQRIRQARDLMKSRMADAPTMAELSDLTGLSFTQLKKGFKLVFGKSAFACLHEDRMERAYTLLHERNLNVSEVAWEVGYINVGHFGTAFRKLYGVRPKDFQMAGL